MERARFFDRLSHSLAPRYETDSDVFLQEAREKHRRTHGRARARPRSNFGDSLRALTEVADRALLSPG